MGENNQQPTKNDIRISTRDLGRLNFLSFLNIIIVGISFWILKFIGLNPAITFVAAVVIGIIYTVLVVLPFYKKIYSNKE